MHCSRKNQLLDFRKTFFVISFSNKSYSQSTKNSCSSRSFLLSRLSAIIILAITSHFLLCIKNRGKICIRFLRPKICNYLSCEKIHICHIDNIPLGCCNYKMAAVIRVKRRIDEEPLNAFILDCKKRKREEDDEDDSTGLVANSSTTNALKSDTQTIVKFAGTVADQVK